MIILSLASVVVDSSFFLIIQSQDNAHDCIIFSTLDLQWWWTNLNRVKDWEYWQNMEHNQFCVPGYLQR